MTVRNLEHVFEPGSVAVIGASKRPGSLGRTVLANIRAAGFAGRIYPVNPKYEEVDGLTCFANVEALVCGQATLAGFFVGMRPLPGGGDCHSIMIYTKDSMEQNGRVSLNTGEPPKRGTRR